MLKRFATKKVIAAVLVVGGAAAGVVLPPEAIEALATGLALWIG